MAGTFNCSECGAPLDYTGNDATIRCPYCNASVIVPEELRQAAPHTAAGSAVPPIMIGTVSLADLMGQASEIAQAVRLARTGNKQEAAQLFREHSHLSQEQAEQIVEQIAAHHPIGMSSMQAETPTGIQVERPQAKPKGSNLGCILLLVILVVGFIALTGGIPFFLVKKGADIGNEAVATAKAMETSVVGQIESTPAPTRPAKPTATPTPSFVSVVSAFGSKGTGPGYFTDARRLGVDGKGNVYVGEYTGGRVQVFNASGKFITQWFAGDKNTLMLGFAVDRNGVVYVADGENITRYTGTTGKSLGTMKYTDPRFGDVAVAPDGGLVAMWYERRNGIFTSVEGAREDLVRFDKQGKVAQVIQGPISSQTGDVALDNSIAVGGHGEVYILSTFSGSVFVFGSDGKLVTRFGTEGDQPGQLNSPRTIAIDQQGRVFVSDATGLQIFNANGGYLTTVELKDTLSWMAFDDQNQLWGLSNNQVIKLKINDKG